MVLGTWLTVSRFWVEFGGDVRCVQAVLIVVPKAQQQQQQQQEEQDSRGSERKHTRRGNSTQYQITLKS